MVFDHSRLDKYAEFFDVRFEQLLPKASGPGARIIEAMRYSALSGGKRIRPYLVMRFCESCGGSREAAINAAAAVECIHTYSLMHDDLPAIDNDDLRRGMPTAHKKFDEATAIIAGDALLTFAFEVLSQSPVPPLAITRMVSILASRAGWSGMAGGQMADILSEKSQPNAELMNYIHMHKTADLLTAAAMCGGICADADEKKLTCIEDYGVNFGMAFQITDDICDSTSTAEEMGKAVGKDKDAGKQNAVVIFGLEKSRELARQYAREAANALISFENARDLIDLVMWLPERRK